MKHIAKKPVVSYKNLPAGFGITGLIAVWLLLEHLGAATWGYWIFWAFAALIVGSGVHKLYTTYGVDLFDVARECDCDTLVGSSWLGDEIPGQNAPADSITGRIDICRTHVDTLIVKLYGHDDQLMYEFPAQNIGLGEHLSVRDLRIKLEISRHR